MSDMLMHPCSSSCSPMARLLMQPWKFLPSSRALSSPTRPDPVTTWATISGNEGDDYDDAYDRDYVGDYNDKVHDVWLSCCLFVKVLDYLTLHTEPCISPVRRQPGWKQRSLAQSFFRGHQQILILSWQNYLIGRHLTSGAKPRSSSLLQNTL